MIKAPCKGCEDRVLYCHATCEKYLEYRERVDELNKFKMLAKELERARNENISRLKKSIRRGKNG